MSPAFEHLKQSQWIWLNGVDTIMPVLQLSYCCPYPECPTICCTEDELEVHFDQQCNELIVRRENRYGGAVSLRKRMLSSIQRGDKREHLGLTIPQNLSSD
eukprot:129815_1